MLNSTQFINFIKNNDSAFNTTNCSNSNSEQMNHHLTETQTVFFTISFSLASIIGLVGNIVVITVILFKRELRHFTNYFFLNLSVADILVLIFCIPTVLQDLYLPDHWIFGKFLCHCYVFIEYCLTSVSSLTIIIISFERYAAISAPLKVKQIFSSKISILTIALIWIISIIFSSPFLIISKYDTINDSFGTINQCYPDLTQFHFIYMTLYITIIIFIPTVFLSFLYIMIIFKLKIHYKCKLNEIYVSASKCLITTQTSVRTSPTSPTTIPTTTVNFSTLSDRTSSLDRHNNLLNQKKRHHIMRIQYRRGFPPTTTTTLANQNLKLTNHDLMYKRFCMKRNNSANSLMSYSSTQSFSRNLNSLRLSITNGNHSQNDARLQKCNHNCNDRKRFTIIILLITVAFFCCQLPVRIFILWSFKFHSEVKNSTNSTIFEAASDINCTNNFNNNNNNQINFQLINLISFATRLIYFLHGISNPLIYNISSSKFRRAFFSLFCMSKC